MRERIDFFDRYAENWDRDHSGPKEMKKIGELVHSFDLRNGEMVLDLGCGTGKLTPFLLRLVGTEGMVACVDFSLEMLRQALRKDTLKAAWLVCARAEAIPFSAGLFDVVVCYRAFPHFESSRTLGEIYRLLRPGGRLIIAHPLSSSEINDIHKNAGGAVSHDVIAPAGEMGPVLREAGFRPVRLIDRPGTYIAIAIKLL